jgi:hypothetical protein
MNNNTIDKNNNINTQTHKHMNNNKSNEQKVT